MYLFPILVGYPIGYVETFRFRSKSFLSFQLFHVNEEKTSGLGLLSSMSLDGSKDIQPVKSTWLVLHSEFKNRALLPLKGNNGGYNYL